MTELLPPPEPWLSRRRLKAVQVATLLLATLAAGWPISGIVSEREERQAGLLTEFKQSWGPDHTLHAPILVVPYDAAEGQPRQYLKIAPATLSTHTRLAPEQKRRGLFAATVYTAATEMKGTFLIPTQDSVDTLLGRRATVRWEDGFVVLKGSELVGMTAEDRLTWDGKPVPWHSCGEVISRVDDCQGALLIGHPHLKAAPEAETAVPFQATITLRGTGTFRQVLEGKQIAAAIAAPWPTPSFTGSMLPAASTVTADDFQARWQAVEYSRPLLRSSPKVAETGPLQYGPLIGVDLLEATPTYRMIHRASKYGILFVVLSFTIYALFELLSNKRIHTVQYGLLGVSMTLFPLLLVSFAEPMGYTAGYAVSAGLVLLQASLYTAAVTRRAVPSVVFATCLAALFGFLYVLLSLETYSLLVGSVALFLVLSVVMAVTQRVDWTEERA